MEEFNSILDRHAPWKDMYFFQDPPEWGTQEIVAVCKARDHLKQKAKRAGDPIDTEHARRARNSCSQFKKSLRKDYYVSASEQAGRDSKQLWRVLKQLFWSKKGKNCINSNNGKLDSKDMANDINDFFADIGPRLAESIPDSMLDIDLYFNGDREMFEFHDITDI